VPRDTRVRLKNHGYDKINAAYAYGGEEMTKDTVEDFLGVHIDHYIIVNVQSFVKIIDAIGGVDINVESRMYYEDPWDDNGGLYIDLYPGLQHMDGKTAVTYVRFRDEEGDIGRIKRQQKFMQACMDKVTSPSIILKIPAVAKEVFSSLRTDLTIRQLVEFAGTLREAKAKGLSADMVPGRPLYIDGISYWIPDISKMRHTVADTLDVEVSRAMRSDFERDAREYEESIPDSATSVPETDHSIGRVSSYAPRRHRAPSYTEEKAEEPPKNTAPTLESEEAKILPPAEVSEPEKTPPTSSPNASRYEEPNPPTQSPRSERLREPTSEESDAPSPSPNSGRKEL